MTEKSQSFWGRIFGGPSDDQAPTHSFEELHRIHNVLLDPQNQVVNHFNKAVLIETLRELAELLIWGDQNDPRVFEYFLEHNLLRHYKRILAVPSHRRGGVAVQLLQTLSILITNISKQTSMFFLFSNNHLNDIIGLGYDLRDEEVLAHFVTLLKTISFKLNKDTIQFFFQVDANNRAHFPLYTEAKKLFNHSEGMVRAAVRMLTINVYSVQDPAMLDFVSSAPCNHYFHEVALHLAEHALHFDRHLEALQAGRSSALKDMGYTMTEMEDYLSYVGDVIEVATPRLRSEVSRKFWDGFVEPVVIVPLIASQSNADSTSVVDAGASTPLSVRPATSLYSVERIFAQLRAPSMLEALACALLAGPAVPVPRPPGPLVDAGATTAAAAASAVAAVAAETASDGSGAPSNPPASEDATAGPAGAPLGPVDTATDGDGASGKTADTAQFPSAPSRRLASSGSIGSTHSLASASGARLARCRDAVLACLRSSDTTAAAATVRALAAAAAARLPMELAAALGLALDPTGDAAAAGAPPLTSYPTGGATGPLGVTAPLSEELSVSVPLPEFSASIASAAGSSRQQLSPRPSLAHSGSFGVSAALSMASDLLVDDLVRSVVTNRMRPVGDGATRRIAAVHRHEISDALLQLLTRRDLPAPAVAAAGWLLSQMLPGPCAASSSNVSSSGAGNNTSNQPLAVSAGDTASTQSQNLPSQILPEDVAALLRSALANACQKLRSDLKGVWADALLPLSHAEWKRLRPVSMRGSLRCQASDLLHFITPPLATRPNSHRPLDPCAIAAVAALATVSRVCALAQVRTLLHTSQIPLEPPLAPYHSDTATITEGALVSISNLQAHPCRVSFRRGDERHALLTVITPNSHGQPLGCVSPHAVLLAPKPNTVGAGTVLSAAPLLATAAEAHDQHAKWLKACVRPTVSMLLEAVNASRQQGMPFSLSSKAHQLGDGVWVLALESGTAVKDVISMLTTSTRDFEDSVADVLAPLLSLEPPTAPPVNPDAIKPGVGGVAAVTPGVGGASSPTAEGVEVKDVSMTSIEQGHSNSKSENQNHSVKAPKSGDNAWDPSQADSSAENAQEASPQAPAAVEV